MLCVILIAYTIHVKCYSECFHALVSFDKRMNWLLSLVPFSRWGKVNRCPNSPAAMSIGCQQLKELPLLMEGVLPGSAQKLHPEALSCGLWLKDDLIWGYLPTVEGRTATGPLFLPCFFLFPCPAHFTSYSFHLRALSHTRIFISCSASVNLNLS